MESPIVGASEDATSEVKQEGFEEIPVLPGGKLRGRPTKRVQAEETPNEVLTALSSVAEAVKGLVSKIDAVSERLLKVETYTETMKPVASPSPEDEVAKPATPGKEDMLILTVKRILGQGDPVKCQFDVSTNPDKLGRTFLLTIIPPKHLREEPDLLDANGKTIIMDHRDKVLSYHEGISGAEMYAKIVYDRCVKWANKNAISYFENMSA